MCVSHSVAERPQHMLMRVSVGIHGEDIEKAIEVRQPRIWCLWSDMEAGRISLNSSFIDIHR